MLVNEAYQWLLIPTQPDPQDNIEWIDNRIPGKDESSIIRASRKLISEGQIVSEYAGSLLRLELDNYLWRDKNQIELKQLWEYLAQYLYLPRFTSSAVLLQAIKNGLISTVPEENFAYAEGWNEAQQRYIGLVIFKYIDPSMNGQSLLVKTEIARGQKESEQTTTTTPVNPSFTNQPTISNLNVGTSSILTSEVEDKADVLPSIPLRRFHGSIEIDPLRINRDADSIAKEVLQHLTRLKGATVKITLEIEAEVLDGVPDDVVRTVTENCNTLKFKTQGFERD